MKRALLSLTTICVLSALGALSQSATAAEYESFTNTYPQAFTMSNVGVHVFSLASGAVEIECEVAKIAGKLAARAPTLSAEAIRYEKCKWNFSGGHTASVGSECIYEFGKPIGTGYPFTATLNMARSGTCGGLISVESCVVALPKQPSPLGTVTFNSISGGMEAVFAISGMEYKSSGCSALGVTNGTHTDGVYKGKSKESGVVI